MYFKHDYFLVRFDAGFFDSLPVSFSISASLFFPLASARFRLRCSRRWLGVFFLLFVDLFHFLPCRRFRLFCFRLFCRRRRRRCFSLLLRLSRLLYVQILHLLHGSFQYRPSKSYSMPLSLIFFILSFSFFANRFNRFLSPPSSLFYCAALPPVYSTVRS